MSVITVRSLPEHIVARLQLQAKGHHRSMEAEVRAILAEALQPLAQPAVRHVNFDLIDRIRLGEVVLEPVNPKLHEVEL